MAANVVVIRDEQEWEIVSRVLTQLEQGGIIVPPEQVEYLDENCPGWEDMIDNPLEYDYGGEADLFVDIARHGNHAASTLDDYLIEAQQNQD